MRKKAYEFDKVIELLSHLQEKTDDISKRLELVYNLGPALEELELDELGEILDAVTDVVDDFHYSLANYMHGMGIEVEQEEVEQEEVEQEEVEQEEVEQEEETNLDKLQKFIEEKFEWEEEEEEEEEIAMEPEEEERVDNVYKGPYV